MRQAPGVCPAADRRGGHGEHSSGVARRQQVSILHASMIPNKPECFNCTVCTICARLHHWVHCQQLPDIPALPELPALPVGPVKPALPDIPALIIRVKEHS